MNLFFWDPCISPHKHYFFKALLKSNFVDSLTVFVDEDVPHERRLQGWNFQLDEPCVSNVEVTYVYLNPLMP